MSWQLWKMADILLDRLPRAWAGRPIDWDFRPMIWFNGQYLRLPEDEKGLPELARETMRRFYRVAVPQEEEVDAFKALVEFYTAGPQEVSDRPGSSRTEEVSSPEKREGSRNSTSCPRRSCDSTCGQSHSCESSRRLRRENRGH